MIISAPSALSPFICSLIGLSPILHPPGKGIEASPNLVNNGPIQKKLALSPLQVQMEVLVWIYSLN